MAHNRRMRWGWLNVALGALAVVLLAAACVVWTRPATGGTGDARARALSDRQGAVTRAAKAEVEAFLGVDHRAMDDVVARVEEGATGAFAEEYAAGERRLRTSTAESRATSRPTVRAVALGRTTARRAVVLVAADARVSNRASGSAPQLRQHRLRLVMVERDGRWLTEQLEFVA